MITVRAAAALSIAPEACVSAVSPWEVAIKASTGKLRGKEKPIRWFRGLAERYQLKEIPLDGDLVCSAAALPFIHRDPFDRVLVALAQAQTLTFLAFDKSISKYAGVKTIW